MSKDNNAATKPSNKSSQDADFTLPSIGPKADPTRLDEPKNKDKEQL